MGSNVISIGPLVELLRQHLGAAPLQQGIRGSLGGPARVIERNGELLAIVWSVHPAARDLAEAFAERSPAVLGHLAELAAGAGSLDVRSEFNGNAWTLIADDSRRLLTLYTRHDTSSAATRALALKLYASLVDRRPALDGAGLGVPGGVQLSA